MEAGLAGDDLEFRALYWQARLSLGSDEFAEGIKEAHKRAVRKSRRPEDVAFRRVGTWRSSAETLAAVASAFGIMPATLRQRSRNSIARGAAAWALVRHAGLTEREAATTLGMGTGSAASQQLAKWRRAALTDARCQAIEAELDRALSPPNF